MTAQLRIGVLILCVDEKPATVPCSNEICQSLYSGEGGIIQYLEVDFHIIDIDTTNASYPIDTIEKNGSVQYFGGINKRKVHRSKRAEGDPGQENMEIVQGYECVLIKSLRMIPQIQVFVPQISMASLWICTGNIVATFHIMPIGTKLKESSGYAPEGICLSLHQM